MHYRPFITHFLNICIYTFGNDSNLRYEDMLNTCLILESCAIEGAEGRRGGNLYQFHLCRYVHYETKPRGNRWRVHCHIDTTRTVKNQHCTWTNDLANRQQVALYEDVTRVDFLQCGRVQRSLHGLRGTQLVACSQTKHLQRYTVE